MIITGKDLSRITEISLIRTSPPRAGHCGLTKGYGPVVCRNKNRAVDRKPLCLQQPHGLTQQDLILEYAAAKHDLLQAGSFAGFPGSGHKEINERPVEPRADFRGGSAGIQGRHHALNNRSDGNNETLNAF